MVQMKPKVDLVGAYIEGIQGASRSWSSETHEQLSQAVSNNPYGVWATVSRELLGVERLDSRQHMLRTGGTTDQVGRGTVIHNMHNAAWGAIFSAAGLRHSESTIVELAVQAGRQRDEAFQMKISSWPNSAGETVTGPVFTWEVWDGKQWVDRDQADAQQKKG